MKSNSHQTRQRKARRVREWQLTATRTRIKLSKCGRQPPEPDDLGYDEPVTLYIIDYDWIER